MAQTSVAPTVQGIIGAKLCVPVERVTPEADIQDDLGADSLAVMEIVMALEDEFGISIPDEEVTRLRTVGATTHWIEEHLA